MSKGDRSADSSIVLTVVAGKPPAVTILTPTLHVVASNRVQLKATYESSIKPVKVEWVCQQQEDSKLVFKPCKYLAKLEGFWCTGCSVCERHFFIIIKIRFLAGE